MGQSSSSQPGKHPRPRGICGVGDLPPNIAVVVDHFSLDLKAYLENDTRFVRVGHKHYTTSTSTPETFSLAHTDGVPHSSSQSRDVEHEEYKVLASEEEKVDQVAGKSDDLKDSYLEAELMDHGGSSSYGIVFLNNVHQLCS